MGTEGSNDEVTSVLGQTSSGPEVESLVGRAVGRYFVIGELGRGAMGVVVRAYDPKLQREVALKIVRTTAMSQAASARMVREAQAMAKLSHPHVVAVYDVDDDPRWGTVVAMEYVAGTTLKAWVRQRRDDVPAIVAAFVQAGRGLVTAHAAGLLHRDFKPDNVLVGEDGRARVTDFGLARIDAGGVDSTMTGRYPPLSLPPALTAVDTVMGTPRYMAPEQHAAGELTAAADQFAFCVSVWEALTGAPPYVANDLESLVQSKHEGPPAWPKHAAVPRAVVEALRRGLAPEPEARFSSMLTLLDALEAAYARRRRNRIAAASGAGVVLVATLAVVAWPEPAASPCTAAREQLGDAWDDARRRASRDAILGSGLSYAKTTWDGVAPDLDAYAEAWVEQHTEACEATRVRGDQSVAMLDLRIGCLEGARRTLAATTELLARADPEVVERASELVSALPSLSRCADVKWLGASVVPPPEAEVAEVEAVRNELARAMSLGNAGKYEAAEASLPSLLQRAEAIGYAPLVTEVQVAVGINHERLGHYEQSEAELTRAVEAAVRLGQWDEAAVASSALAMVAGSFRGQPQRGLDFAVTAVGLAARASQPPLRQAEVHRVIGVLHDGAGDPKAATAELRAALAFLDEVPDVDPLDVDAVRMSLAATLLDSGDFAGAQREQEAVVALRSQVLGADHPRTANARHNLANMLMARGDLPGAEREYRAALAVMRAALGERHPSVGMARSNLAGVLDGLGRHDEAFAEFEVVVEIFREAYGPEHPNVAGARLNLATRLGERGDNAAAAEELRAVIDSLVRSVGTEHPSIEIARLNLGIELMAMGRADEAIDETRRAVESRVQRLGPEHVDVIEARVALARLLTEAGRAEQALPLTAAAWRFHATSDDRPARRAGAALAHAKALRATEAPAAEVTAMGEVAISIHRGAGDEDGARSVREWLDEGARDQ
ncbi:serine/threonine-protein kinase [Paraliomyxa miuraensis]|uniref:serine/threonine-protein kinase n=1 Tax=Paraliomyxa miuraensis TaxID=376150 RepID=UPI0022593830|nr:serine/threonine-protein kinase [Paraliomyxa miuraensis]MCX4241982.1 tetratricopeptide repeat protein [Paraliomyxa miuraensis]